LGIAHLSKSHSLSYLAASSRLHSLEDLEGKKENNLLIKILNSHLNLGKNHAAHSGNNKKQALEDKGLKMHTGRTCYPTQLAP
jgi:hypothetical protein